MADPLTSLRDALANAPQPVALSAAFIENAGATPAAGFDAQLQAAYRLTPGTGLAVTLGAVQPVAHGEFRITDARLSFLGYDSAKSNATLRFRQDAAIQVLVEVVLDDWSWPSTFPMMTGWPFDQLAYGTPTFVFSTEKTDWAWAGGATVTVAQGQNFVGTLTVPAVLSPTFALAGVPWPPGPRTVAGPVTVDKVTEVDPPPPTGAGPRGDGPTVLYPDVDLRAPLPDAPVSVFFLKARQPAVGLLVDGAWELDESGETLYVQTPSLYFAAKFAVGGDVQLDLRTRVMQGGSFVGFSLIVDPASETWLTPAAAVGLLAGAQPDGSFLDGVPAPLQQFVSKVGLQGLSLSGRLPPQPSIASVGMTLATRPGTRLVLFTDPTNGQEFAIDSFDVTWLIVDPLGSAQQLVQVTATFALWPAVFDGPFSVSIDQDMRIDGRFDGTVALRTLLTEISKGAVELPTGVEASLSGAAVQLDPSARSYGVSAALDAAFSFVEYDGRPLIRIEDMLLSLSATAPAGGGKTTYSAGFAGVIGVGPVVANVGAQYDGAATPSAWDLAASLARPIELGHVVDQFFRPSASAYDFPDFLRFDLTVVALAVDATVPSKGAARYDVSGALSWTVPLADLPMRAQAGLRYDPTRGAGNAFSGSVVGTLGLGDLGTEVQVGYRFGPAARDAADLGRPLRGDEANASSRVLWVAWEGIGGEYDLVTKRLTLRLAGWSAGRVIRALVQTIGDPGFELESPWDFLERVSLDGLMLVIDFDQDAQQRFYAEYTLARPIDLGFLTIDGLYFRRGQGQQVTLAIAGRTTIKSLQGPLFDTKQGQDVRNLPAVPGQGSAYFDLRLLVLGQRVGIRGAKFDSTKAVIAGLAKAPTTTAGKNPVNPTGSGQLEPYYDPTRGWLFAADFGILKVGSQYTFECMVVLNDPDLYGLRLACGGPKAKVLDGLVLDVLYKKVTDDVGVFQVEFTFPKALRTIDLGSFAITLPTIRVQIYTNGDFLFDFGFPYNLDFSRSFGVQAIIPPGVPVLGAAGFYFGRLSIGAAAQLPQSTPGRALIGSFSPAIVFGLGVQLGVGRYFEKGPLKAGFSITVFGIVEGVIAAWHPPDPSGQLPAASGGSLEGDYFFRLKGTFGLIGKLYGSVDFVVVKADLNLTVTLSARIVYESFKDIELSASASVTVSLTITINLGLFAIELSFSFAATITANLTIQTPNHRPPWYAPQVERTEPAAALPRPRIVARAKTAVPAADPPTLHLHPAPQFTVLSADGETLAAQEGAFVFLLATDAPTAGGSGNRGGSSFEALCAALFPWVIDALANPEGDRADLAAAAATSVSGAELEHYVASLAAAPISEDDIETKFLQPGFNVIVEPPAGRQANLQAGATLFPAFAGLSLTIPALSGTGTTTIALDDYVKITPAYREDLAARFAQLAARLEDEPGGGRTAAAPGTVGGGGEPLAQFLFEDWFGLVAQQLLQAGADAIGDYAYALRPKDSIATIVAWANGAGNAVGARDVANPNLTHPLSAGKPLRLRGLTYTVQRDDSLQAIAARYTDASADRRWSLTPAQLITANQALQGLVAAGTTVTFAAASHVTRPGESFASLAGALGTTVDLLAADAALYPRIDLLAPAVSLTIPDIVYTTAAGGTDTLGAIASQFALPVEALAGDAANQAVEDLFGAGTIRIAGLERLAVADVWSAVAATDQVAQVAGMVARFQLHGMRLPEAAGLLLPDDFLYPTGQADWGLHQLSGQQFPTAPLTPTPTYAITLGKSPGKLAWLQLPAPTIDLSEQARELYYVLGYARGQVYDPTPSLTADPAVTARPKRYAVQSNTPWSTSDQQELLAATAPPSVAAVADTGPQVTPMLWNLPSSLLRRVDRRQAALERTLSTKAALPYLPVVEPQVATTDPASGHTAYAPVDRFALATRIQFGVKQLAQTDDCPPQRPDANDVVPLGPGNAGAPPPLAPFGYELVGPGPADAVLLERLLTAMDSVGQDVVSGLFLLYPTGGPGTAGLTSRASAEFLSFITQTNLSTETNPPATAEALARVAGAQPQGIANSTAEFVRLLWELSTVRSGGYYFYYQLLQEGTGLPDALFDASGTATLTLVVAYDRTMGTATGGRLTDYVNAVVTTEPVDVGRSVMTLESQPSPAPSLPLTGVETLAGLAELYGTDVGRLVALNASATLSTGSAIGLEGIVHQVDAADLASGDPLSAIAARYSAGAQTPISAAAISAFNLGAQPVLGAALRIPPLTYVVSGAAGGAGATFASLSAYYGLPYDALGYAARLVPGLLGHVTIAVDSEERDTQQNLGTGNAGVTLTRDAPPDRCPAGQVPCLPANPTQPQVTAFASATLLSLYTILSAGVQANAFFDGSPQGLPFGPRSSLTPDEAQALRDPQARRAALALAAADPLEYVQAVGFGAFAHANAAPAGDPAGPLPPASANPYAGVGTPIQLHLRWLDVFGNQIVSAFSAPPAGYPGPLNDIPAPVGYSDRIIGLGRWPNVRAAYRYAGPAGTPELKVSLALRTAAYDVSHDSWQQAAANDLTTYTRIYFQLNQDYDGLGVPGLSGQAVSMSLTNTLLASPQVPLADADAERLRAFVAAALTYVWRRSRGEDGGTPPTVTIVMPVDVGAVAADDVIPLSLSLTLSRQAALCDPALRAVSGGLSDTTEILPVTGADPDGLEVSIDEFATSAETAFATDEWQLRIGTSTAGTGEVGAGGRSLWAVRMAVQPGRGLGYSIQPGATFYAPAPVAVALRGGPASIGLYATGKPFPDGASSLTFAGVDMNAWAQQALAAIDAFLSATYAAPAFVVDQLLTTDPEKDGNVVKILEHKRTLAAAIARTVKPILPTSDDERGARAAEDKLYQVLLDELSTASTVTAVTVFSVTAAKARGALAPGVAAPPRFYGQPLGTPPGAADGTAEPNFALSTAKIPLTPSTGDGSSRLAFLFSSKSVAEQAYVALRLQYAMSHLEHDIRHVPGVAGYEQSQWIKFVTGPFTAPLQPPPADPVHAGAVDLPVVLRALPQPPSVTNQTAAATHRDSAGRPAVLAAEPPAELARWDYGFGYLYRAAAQDAVSATVEFNRGPSLPALEQDPSAQLFQALAQFVTVQPAIAADLEAYLRPVDGRSRATDANVVDAGFALDALEAVVGAVATAYDSWSRWRPPQRLDEARGPAHVVHEFDVALADRDGRARVEIRSTDPQLPRPVVAIEPDRYVAHEMPAKSPVRFAYEYSIKGSDPVEWLSYDAALPIPARIVGYDDLPLFARQDGYASVQVRRNAYLVPDHATSETFRFSTPKVTFADRIVPLLAYSDFDLGSVAQPPSSLVTYLGDFFASLLSSAHGQKVAVKMTSGYAYRVAPSIAELPWTLLPIHLLPPTEVTPGGARPMFVDAVAGAVVDWLRANPRPAADGSRLTFGLEVFAGLDQLEQKPLLTIADLHVDVADLSDV